MEEHLERKVPAEAAGTPACERRQVLTYLAVTFGIAYALQAVAALVRGMPNTGGAWQLVVAASMFAPLIGTIAAGGRISDMGLKPRVRQNARSLLFAWLAPAALTAVGSALYFVAFPQHLDTTWGYVASAAGPEAVAELEASGLSLPALMAITMAVGMLYAPFVNALLAFGEEVGWRGFLYPRLKGMLGPARGLVAGGAVWGAWHWPLIALVGYEYGAATGNTTGYWGEPATGMLAFCAITVGLGVIHDWVYGRSGTIWAPSLLHGSLNAVASVPFAVCVASTGSARLLGPSWMGLLAGLPFLVLAAFLVVRYYATGDRAEGDACGDNRDGDDDGDRGAEASAGAEERA